MGAGASAQRDSSVPNIQKAPSGSGFDVGPIEVGKGPTTDNKVATFKVNLAQCSVSTDQGLSIPEEFFIKLSYESLDLLNTATLAPIIQFPYQSIICWGSSPTIFQFNAFPTTLNSNKLKETIRIVVNTPQGKEIDGMTMAKIRALMADMESTAVSKDEFTTLKRLILLNKYELVVSYSSTSFFLRCVSVMNIATVCCYRRTGTK
jgi:hypothetical protein